MDKTKMPGNAFLQDFSLFPFGINNNGGNRYAVGQGKNYGIRIRRIPKILEQNR
jgi:hypothetical protein